MFLFFTSINLVGFWRFQWVENWSTGSKWVKDALSGLAIVKLLDIFLGNLKQFVLNDQCSNWAGVNAGVPKGSILGNLPFLIYINNLPENLQWNPKLFADDTSLFSAVGDPNSFVEQFCNDLCKITFVHSRWKRAFILILLNKPKNLYLLAEIKILIINDTIVNQVSQKNLRIILE